MPRAAPASRTRSSRRSRSPITLAALAATVCASLVAACEARQFGLPRTPVEARSPDGTAVAWVRNHLSIDPPHQSLWLEGPGGKTRLIRLGEDTHWCNAIAWSPDSRRVAYLVQDASAMVFDAATHRLAEHLQLVEHDHVPTSRAVRALRFLADGNALEARICNRRSGERCTNTRFELAAQRK